ncbi:MAG TPA: amidohydrolase [Gemmatimonadaceae bacterium]|nr:amidohydrolase [Gemmatimonadaceae bacterium]
MKMNNLLARCAAVLALLAPAHVVGAQGTGKDPDLERRITAVMPKVVAWRRDIHQNPELSYEEERTAKVVADHLKTLGLEVRANVGGHGVVGVLRGARQGGVVALRADMDALPVTEQVDVPFRSRKTATLNGQTVGVMHACGHDTHVAMLMGAAEVLAAMKPRLRGTVVFIFQPAEERTEKGMTGGAAKMIADGALANPAPTAIFGLHVFSSYATGTIVTRPGGLMASSDALDIVVHGRQTHGAMPWAGVDPIVVASQIVTGLQTVVSRQTTLTRTPAIVTIGSMHAGVARNIIPDSVVMSGTIRVFDDEQQNVIHERVKRTAERIAEASGATATVTIDRGNYVTSNDAALFDRMRPTLQRVALTTPLKKDSIGDPTTTAEDFSQYQRRIPGLFVFLGVTPPGTDPRKAPANHSPSFYVDEAALPVGVRLLTSLALDYLGGR